MTTKHRLDVIRRIMKGRIILLPGYDVHELWSETPVT